MAVAGLGFICPGGVSVRHRPGLAAGAGSGSRLHGDGLRVLPDGGVRAVQVGARPAEHGRRVPLVASGGLGRFCRGHGTGWGLLRMNISETYKAYLGVSWLYLVSSAFTLAKTLRDAHEAALAQARAEARAQLRRDMQQGLTPDAQ